MSHCFEATLEYSTIMTRGKKLGQSNIRGKGHQGLQQPQLAPIDSTPIRRALPATGERRSPRNRQPSIINYARPERIETVITMCCVEVVACVYHQARKRLATLCEALRRPRDSREPIRWEPANEGSSFSAIQTTGRFVDFHGPANVVLEGRIHHQLRDVINH
ncbi:hypothetical protein V8E54_000177 [Elaphomyces granulatus]